MLHPDVSHFAHDPHDSFRRKLTLFDSICIMVGIIVGAGFYESSSAVAGLTRSAGELIGVWALGGVVSLVGALCYAELAAADPRDGGDYVFLTRAFGRPVGFLFAWIGFWVVRPGNIGAMALVFGKYAAAAFPLPEKFPRNDLFYGTVSVILLTGVHAMGIRPGKWTQNLLTSVKAVGLLTVILGGFSFAIFQSHWPSPLLNFANVPHSNLSISMILVLFAYGGWNEIAYVAAEVRHPRRNLLRALILGVIAVSGIYLLGTAACLYASGQFGFANEGIVGIMYLRFGPAGRTFITLLISISALGAVSGMIFTGSRIFYAVGKDYQPLRLLGRLGRTLEAPLISLAMQAGVTLALLLSFGLYENGFERMIIFTAPAFYFFFALTGVALLVLRIKEPSMTRPFKVPFYPVPPLLFIAFALLMLYASTTYAMQNRTWEALWTIIVSALGLAFCVLARRKEEPRGFAIDLKANNEKI